jgi:predicted transcriptional regulator
MQTIDKLCDKSTTNGLCYIPFENSGEVESRRQQIKDEWSSDKIFTPDTEVEAMAEEQDGISEGDTGEEGKTVAKKGRQEVAIVDPCKEGNTFVTNTEIPLFEHSSDYSTLLDVINEEQQELESVTFKIQGKNLFRLQQPYDKNKLTLIVPGKNTEWANSTPISDGVTISGLMNGDDLRDPEHYSKHLKPSKDVVPDKHPYRPLLELTHIANYILQYFEDQLQKSKPNYDLINFELYETIRILIQTCKNVFYKLLIKNQQHIFNCHKLVYYIQSIVNYLSGTYHVKDVLNTGGGGGGGGYFGKYGSGGPGAGGGFVYDAKRDGGGFNIFDYEGGSRRNKYNMKGGTITDTPEWKELSTFIETISDADKKQELTYLLPSLLKIEDSIAWTTIQTYGEEQGIYRIAEIATKALNKITLPSGESRTEDLSSSSTKRQGIYVGGLLNDLLSELLTTPSIADIIHSIEYPEESELLTKIAKDIARLKHIQEHDLDVQHTQISDILESSTTVALESEKQLKQLYDLDSATVVAELAEEKIDRYTKLNANHPFIGYIRSDYETKIHELEQFALSTAELANCQETLPTEKTKLRLIERGKLDMLLENISKT